MLDLVSVSDLIRLITPFYLLKGKSKQMTSILSYLYAPAILLKCHGCFMFKLTNGAKILIQN